MYQLQGLKSHTWYEVKISYPASVCNFMSFAVAFCIILLVKPNVPFVEWQIPASFSIQLKKDNSDSEMNRNRRLLNAEKLIFKTDNINSEQVWLWYHSFKCVWPWYISWLGGFFFSPQGKLYVLVTVEPEGIVAIPHVPERQYIIFNIGKPGFI